jgi:hypothetical protein
MYYVINYPIENSIDYIQEQVTLYFKKEINYNYNYKNK